MKALFRYFFVITMCLLMGAATAFGGIVMERVVSVRSPGQGVEKEKIITYFQDNKVKTLQSDGSYVVADLDKGKLIYVDPSKKEYFESSIDEMVKQVQKSMKSLKAQFQGLPPEQRAMIEKMMGLSSSAKSKFTLKSTGKKAKIAGYTAYQYVIMKNGKKAGEYWVSEGVRELIAKELDRDKIEKFERAMSGLMSEGDFLGTGDKSEMVKLEEKIHKKGEVLKEVKYIDMMGSTSTEIDEVVSIREEKLPDSIFAIPSGYKKTKSFVEEMNFGN